MQYCKLETYLYRLFYSILYWLRSTGPKRRRGIRAAGGAPAAAGKAATTKQMLGASSAAALSKDLLLLRLPLTHLHLEGQKLRSYSSITTSGSKQTSER